MFRFRMWDSALHFTRSHLQWRRVGFVLYDFFFQKGAEYCKRGTLIIVTCHDSNYWQYFMRPNSPVSAVFLANVNGGTHSFPIASQAPFGTTTKLPQRWNLNTIFSPKNNSKRFEKWCNNSLVFYFTAITVMWHTLNRISKNYKTFQDISGFRTTWVIITRFLQQFH